MSCKECGQDEKLNEDEVCWSCWKKANPSEVKDEKIIQKENFTPGLEYTDLHEDEIEEDLDVVKHDVKQDAKQFVKQESFNSLLNRAKYEAFIGVRVPLDVKDHLDIVAEKEGITLSELIRKAIIGLTESKSVSSEKID